jgi:hypothetical protein
MKAKKPLLHILSLLFIGSTSMAQNWPLNWPTSEGNQWSLDGQVFQSFDHKPMVQNTGTYDVLLLTASGDLSSQALYIEANTTAATPTLLIDAQGPEIHTQWNQAKVSSHQVTYGPNSNLSFHVINGDLIGIEIDKQAIPLQDSPIQMTQAASEIKLLASDEFGNQTTWVQQLTADFTPPDFTWELQPPSVKINEQWHAGQTAQLIIDNNETSKVTWLLNQQAIAHNNKEAWLVSHGDVITATDELGNTTTQTLNWQLDNTAPTLNILVDGVAVESSDVVNLRVNQLMKLSTTDAGVGVLSQKYKGKRRSWQTLPKSFRFLSKGRYKIKIHSQDHVGNQLEKYLTIKVKRSSK